MTNTKAKTKSKAAAKPAAPAENKKDKVLALLRRESGATIGDLTEATGWLPHSTRAVLTGLRKKGFAIDKTKVDGVTHYSIKTEPSA